MPTAWRTASAGAFTATPVQHIERLTATPSTPPDDMKARAEALFREIDRLDMRSAENRVYAAERIAAFATAAVEAERERWRAVMLRAIEDVEAEYRDQHHTLAKSTDDTRREYTRGKISGLTFGSVTLAAAIRSLPAAIDEQRVSAK